MRRIEPTAVPGAVRQVPQKDLRRCVSCPTVKKFNTFAYEMPTVWPESGPSEFACSTACYESWRSSGKSAG